jgi:hypothetical protein
MPPDGFHHFIECHLTKEARRTLFLFKILKIMLPPDGCHHFIECHLTKVFSIVVFTITGFHSWEARRTLFLCKILKFNVVIVIIGCIDG